MENEELKRINQLGTDESLKQELQNAQKLAMKWAREALANPAADWSTLSSEEATVIIDRCNQIFKLLVTTPTENISCYGHTLMIKEDALDLVEEPCFDDGKYVLERFLEKGDLDFEKEFNMSKHQLILMLMYGVWEEKNSVNIDFMPSCDALLLDKPTFHMVKIGLRRFIEERNDGKAFVSFLQEAYSSVVEISVYIILALAEAAKWPLKPVNWAAVKKENQTLTVKWMKDLDKTIKTESRRAWDGMSREERLKNEKMREYQLLKDDIDGFKRQQERKMGEIRAKVDECQKEVFEAMKKEHIELRGERQEVLNSYDPSPMMQGHIYSGEEMEVMTAETENNRVLAQRIREQLAQKTSTMRDRLFLRKGQFCLARKHLRNAAFEEAQVIEQLDENTYRVQFLRCDEGIMDIVDVNLGAIANTEAPLYEPEFSNTDFTGLRVVAFIKMPHDGMRWCAGTVASRPHGVHNDDLLVFFDDGFEGYVEYSKIKSGVSQECADFKKNLADKPQFQSEEHALDWLRPIIESIMSFPLCLQSLSPCGRTIRKQEVYTLIEKEESRRFIHRYLEVAPLWPLIQMKKPTPDRPPQAVSFNSVGDRYSSLKTRTAYCVHVDRSMCVLRFPSNSTVPGANCFVWPCTIHNHTEGWVYRGSPRLNAVNLQTSDNSNMSSRQKEKNRKKFESAMQGVASLRLQTSRKTNLGAESDGGYQPKKTAAELAAKELAKRKEKEFTVVPYPLRPLPQIPRVPHEVCNGSCLNGLDRNPIDKAFQGISPLTIPVLCGWQRLVYTYELDKPSARYRGPKDVIMYRAPCGTTFRDFHSLTEYLQACNSQLTIDLFNFDAKIDILGRVVVDPKRVMEEDYTKGNEFYAIPAVNTVDMEEPPVITYGSRRFPFNDDVDISTINQNFCSGCDCEGDCSDASKCACQQLTADNFNRLARSFRPKDYGYENRSLVEKTISGIFECNENCSCNKRSCFNRVVQNDIKYPLQLFKTAGCGWGVRAVCDIPKGAFIANYVGALMTDAIADHSDFHGQDFYFADLDLNDVVENQKTQAYGLYGHLDLGIGSDEEEDEDDPKSDEDSQVPQGESSDSDHDISLPKRSRQESPEEEIQPRRRQQSRRKKNEAAARRRAEKAAVVPRQEIFKWSEYFRDKELYVVDAAKKGNIGRFFNHSCDPNIETQHVLVDSHDLRLPWSAFFAVRNIKAGEELCWNYGYSPDAINENRHDSQQLYCECGAINCQGRLL